MNRSVALTQTRTAAMRGGLQPPKYTVKARRHHGQCQFVLRKRNKKGDTRPCEVFLLAGGKTWAEAARAAAMVCRPGGQPD